MTAALRYKGILKPAFVKQMSAEVIAPYIANAPLPGGLFETSCADLSYRLEDGVLFPHELECSISLYASMSNWHAMQKSQVSVQTKDACFCNCLNTKKDLNQKLK